MACCVFTAYIMNRIIKGLDVLDLRLIQIQYNDFDDGPADQIEPSSVKTLRVQIRGMTCAACVHTIEQSLSSLDGIERVSVSLPLERATIVYDTEKLTSSNIEAAIEKSGYETTTGEQTAEQTLEVLTQSKQLASLRLSFMSAATLSGILATSEAIRTWLPAKLNQEHGLSLFVVNMLLACWVQLFTGRWIHSSAWNWRTCRANMNMNTLISLSLLLGVSLSFFNIYLQGWRQADTYFAAGCFLATVITAGQYLDSVLKRRSVANFAQLYQLQSEIEHVQIIRENGTQIPVPAYLLRKNEQFILKPMSIIPCDCYVLEGKTVVDESTMTGESLPSSKVVGDLLMSGTRNISSRIVAVVSAEQQDSSLQRLIDGISVATEQRSSQHGNLEKIVVWFVAAIIILASISAFISFSYSSGPFILRLNLAAQRAMAVLAASCPCALGLAIPSATIAGMDAAWTCGALLTGGERTIEDLSLITHIVVDKTGTMTEGQLHVAAHDLMQGIGLDDSCSLLYLTEREAKPHPAGKAVFQWALQQLPPAERSRLVDAKATEVEQVLGKGLSCTIAAPGRTRTKVHVGNLKFLEDAGVQSIPVRSKESNLHRIAVHFAFHGRYAGSLGLQEKVREEAPRVIQTLNNRGLNVTMLTGDTPESASIVAKALDIQVLSARSLPHEKQNCVESLQSRGNKVLMIGDGVNDTLAQSTADVGVEFRHDRSLVPGAADVVILSRSLETLPKLLEIAKMTVEQSSWNVKWAIGYNVVTVSLAFGVFERWGLVVDASVAGTLMACSSLIILLLSVRLRQKLSYICQQ